MQRRWVPVAVLPLLCWGLLSCGEAKQQVVSVSAQAAADVKTALANSTEAISVSCKLTATLDGEVILDSRSTSMKDGSASEGTTTTGGMDVAFRTIGSQVFYGFPNLPDGKDWVLLEPADMKTIGLDMDSLRQQSGTDQLAFLSSVSSSIKTVGTDRIDGVDTKHYRVTVDLAAGLKQRKITGMMRDGALGLLGDSTEMDVWIGEDDLIHRVVYSADLAKAPNPPEGMPDDGTIRYEMNLTDFNEPVSIDPPDAASVMSYADYGEMVRGGSQN